MIPKLQQPVAGSPGWLVETQMTLHALFPEFLTQSSWGGRRAGGRGVLRRCCSDWLTGDGDAIAMYFESTIREPPPQSSSLREHFVIGRERSLGATSCRLMGDRLSGCVGNLCS